jgi:death-on-curing protein
VNRPGERVLLLDAAHLEQRCEHGGLPGIRDENALEAASARPQQQHNNEPDSDHATLAGEYAFRLAQAHPFNDGNRRATFLVAMIFLGFHGKDLDATEAEVV